MRSFCTIAIFLAGTLSACAHGIGPGEGGLEDGPDAGLGSADDPDDPPSPDASLSFVCNSGTSNFEDPASGNCYMFFDNTQGWDGGKAACSSLGGGAHLVSIGSEQENELVKSMIGNAQVWIGFSDTAAEGTFAWVTGESASYQNWRSGEPNNGSGNEDCAVIEGDRGGSWDDRSCANALRFLCERE